MTSTISLFVEDRSYIRISIGLNDVDIPEMVHEIKLI